MSGVKIHSSMVSVLIRHIHMTFPARKSVCVGPGSLLLKPCIGRRPARHASSNPEELESIFLSISSNGDMKWYYFDHYFPGQDPLKRQIGPIRHYRVALDIRTARDSGDNDSLKLLPRPTQTASFRKRYSVIISPIAPIQVPLAIANGQNKWEIWRCLLILPSVISKTRKARQKGVYSNGSLDKLSIWQVDMILLTRGGRRVLGQRTPWEDIPRA